MAYIEFKNFSKSYGDVAAVKDINLSVDKGQIVGFVGKNGAGKTTTIRCMTNMIFPTEGTITINGFDSVKDTKTIKGFTGYVAGDSAFYDNITCKELFRLALQFTDESMEKADMLSNYFELSVNKLVSELSLGNRRKVAIIQALLKNGNLLILDEPTSGLDPLMQTKFFELILKEKKKGVTVFLSSHNLAEIEKYCDRAVIIKDGAITDDLDMKTFQIKHKQVVSYVTKNGLSENYIFDGNANELISKLSSLDLESIEIKNMSIEDEFMKYYKGEGKDE